MSYASNFTLNVTYDIDLMLPYFVTALSTTLTTRSGVTFKYALPATQSFDGSKVLVTCDFM
jgi:hypothetical protein